MGLGKEYGLGEDQSANTVQDVFVFILHYFWTF